jgi:hypothetical protein
MVSAPHETAQQAGEFRDEHPSRVGLGADERGD